MSKPRISPGGRPKVKGCLRNFKFRRDLDEFLAGESERTGRDMTLILERSLESFKQLKPSARDAELSKAFSEAA